MKALWQLIVLLFTIAWVALVLASPVLSVWLATSLISFHGGPRELALFGGALLFPVLPIAWEIRATRQFKARLERKKMLVGKPPKRWLSAPRRIVLKTLALNLAFIAVLLVWFPQTAFEALATRGDWFVGDSHETWANVTRKGCYGAASGLEWLYELAHPNPYKKKGDDVPPPPDVTPTPVVPSEPFAHRWLPHGGWPDAGTQTPPIADNTPDAGTPDTTWSVGSTSWPWPDEIDPYVASMGPHEEQSLQAVGSYLASNHGDPFERVKALHDWVTTRLRYDLSTLGQSQQAGDVFTRRTGVCEGYARLMVALGNVTGDKINYVTGDVREENGEPAPVGHAWNAVEVRGAWYLIDATWDDPQTKDGHKEYRTDYLFIPPSVAALDHFPDDARWQLLTHPLSRGEFLRQPLARPGLAREGLTLLAPDRPIVEVKDALEVKLENPKRLNVMVQLTSAGGAVDCGIDDAASLSVRCPVDNDGKYKAMIFGGHERYGTYHSLAAIDVIRRR